MKKLLGSTLSLLIVLIILIVLITMPAIVQAKPYFKTIFGDPTHPKMSASILYTSQFKFDGGVTDVAIIYHRADKSDTLWPRALLDLGMMPVSWTLLELGGGGNRESAFFHGGLSLNVAQTLLGPITKALEGAGGKAATFGKLLVSPNGSGLKLSLGWKSDIISNGGIKRFDELSFPPRYGIGYVYQW